MSVDARLTSNGAYATLAISSATNLGVPTATQTRTVRKVVVAVTATNASAICDTAGTATTTGNIILPIPASTTVGTIYSLDWPCFAGIGIVPGSGVTLNVSWD